MRAAAATLAILACLAASHARAADAPDGIVVGNIAGPGQVITADALAQMPAVTLPIAFDTEHGPRQGTFTGPLLWTVLDHAGAIEAAKPREFVRQIVTVAGRDGYTAVLALGEIAPAFENKQVIVADAMDGKPLGPDHLRIIVPGDRRGGRSVHDLVRITVAAP